MPLFKKKKEDLSLPELPELPRFPTYQQTITPVSEITTIKSGIEKQKTPIIPLREKLANLKPVELEKPIERAVTRIEEKYHERPFTHAEEKPLFVKIDNYKEALHMISKIKAKLTEAEHRLDALMRIKEEEDREIQTYREDIEAIKNKLLAVDKELFET